MKSIKIVDEWGNIRYKNEKGQFHREDGPASIWSDGTKFYYLNGKHYRKEDYETKVIKLKLKRILDL